MTAKSSVKWTIAKGKNDMGEGAREYLSGKYLISGLKSKDGYNKNKISILSK